MIHRDRPGIPRILDEKCAEWTAELLECDDKFRREKLEKRYRHREIRARLVEMFDGKCAYCESRILHVDYGHIEHFRPKRGPQGSRVFAFVWTNLLLACGRCNGTENKGTKFPVSSSGKPLLIDPSRDEPGDHLDFIVEPATEFALVQGADAAGMTTIKVLGLNRPDLLKNRSDFVKKLVCLKRLHEKTNDPRAAALLAESRLPAAEYSAFAKRIA